MREVRNVKGWLGSAGVVLAVIVACSESDEVAPGGSAGRAGGDAGESGEAGGGSGGKGSGGRAGANGKGGAGGKAGAASGGRATGTGGAGGTTAGEPGAGGMLGEPGSLLPSHGRGTRLDVKELRAGDMPPVFVTFFDTELGVDCRFVTATDGKMRCLPPYTARVPIRAGEMFLDDACTVPVAIGDPTCVAAEDTWLTEIVPSSDPCEQRTELVSRATLLADGLPVYSNAGGGCTESGTTGVSYHHFSLAEADPGDFVEGKIEIVETPTRLSVQRLVAEDGAFRTLALADPSAMRECRVLGSGDGAVCVPAPVFSGRDYRASDDQCKVPLSLGSCTVPLTVVDLVERDDFTVFEAGPEYTGTIYGGVNTCDVVTDETAPLYEIGDVIPRSELPSVTSAYQGSGRLRHLVYADAAGTELAAGTPSGSSIASEGGLFDTQFDAACSIYRYEDLAQYCIPDDVTTESPNNLYYSDAGCTQQVAVCGDRGCPRDVAMLAGNGQGAVCGVIPDFVKVLTLGDPVALDELYIWYGGRPAGMECDGPFPTDGYGVLREITGETDASAFVKLLPAGG